MVTSERPSGLRAPPRMLSTASQLQFATEFLGLLVAASGLALVALGPAVVRGSSKLVLASGFAVLGAVAFAHGSLLVTAHADLLGAGRAVGAGLLLAGVPGWKANQRSRLLVVAAGSLLLVGAATEAAGGAHLLSGAVLAAGNLLLAGALLVAARRSIAARVAANAAGTLLLVVLVVSVALSSVISHAVARDRLVALATLARVDADSLAASSGSALSSAVSLTAAIDQSFGRGGTLGRKRAGDLLDGLADGYPHEAVGYLPSSGGAPLAPAGADRLVAEATTLRAVGAVSCSKDGGVAHSTIAVLAGRLVAIGADPVCRRGGGPTLGTVVVVAPISMSAISAEQHLEGVGIAVLASGRVVASSRPPPPTSVLAAASSERSPRRTGSHFVAVARIAGEPFLVVTTSSTAAVSATEASLARTLFVIALGGTVLALGLAALTGDRITSGLRRLTAVARRIQEGGVSERSGLVSDDEVGSLSAAFDGMVASVEEQGYALRDAAASEARLRGRLEAVVAGMGDALVAVDAAGSVTAFNRAAGELTGLDPGTALGRAVGEVVVLSGVDGVDLDVAAVVSEGPVADRRAELRRGDGVGVPVAVSIGTVRGPDDEATGSVLVLRDLRREEELERMKRELLSRVGHELRTPLTGILGYADILLRREVPAERARQWHAEIVASAKRQLRTIRLLEFFASSGGRGLAMRAETVDLGRLAHGVVAGWSERLPPGVSLQVRVGSGVPPALGDPRWLGLVLDELIDNAVKFSPDGGSVLVAVSAEPPTTGPGGEEVAGRGRVLLVVRDHGRGMTRTEIAAVFADFVQGDSSDTRRFGGLGLGLSFVQRVVEAHGGEVHAKSAPRRGTLLSVLLPAAGLDASADHSARTGAGPGAW